MAIGTSGRLVIEVDPDFKKHFYTVLETDGLTLKEWFLRAAQEHINKRDDQIAPQNGIEQPGKLRK